jgi:hypothetical protein
MSLRFSIANPKNSGVSQFAASMEIAGQQPNMTGCSFGTSFLCFNEMEAIVCHMRKQNHIKAHNHRDWLF